ncbi:MAG: MATE family efflux transporter [Lachnospiraceae bacterium]|nr:MATE family efflux transporter [Lachnospiraceae bacterium]
MLQKLKNRYIGNKAFYRMTLAIAVPIMIQNGISNFVSMLDNIMVGSVGTEQMTGVSIVNQLIFVFNLMIFGTVSGAGIFGAQFHGNGDHKGVRDTFRFKLISCALMTALGAAVFLFFGDDLIRMYLQGEGAIEQIEASFGYAKQYLFIMMIGLIPFFVSQCYSSTLRETGETMLPMVSGIVAVIVNLCFNSLLIFGLFGLPKLGSAGAAIATVISRFVEAAIVMLVTHMRHDKYRFIEGAFRSFRVPGHLVGGILQKGIPLVLNETLWAGGMAILNQCYSVRAFQVVSAVNISSTIANVLNVSFIAMGNAIGIIIGQMLGAGKTEEAVDADRKLIAFSVVSSVLFAAVLFAISSVFPNIYRVEQEIRDMATSFIRIAALCMPIGALANACYFTLRSGGKIMVTVLFDSCYVWAIVVPLAYCLSRFTSLPIVPLFFCCQFVEIGKCIIGLIMIKSGIWIQKIVN